MAFDLEHFVYFAPNPWQECWPLTASAAPRTCSMISVFSVKKENMSQYKHDFTSHTSLLICFYFTSFSASTVPLLAVVDDRKMCLN